MKSARDARQSRLKAAWTAAFFLVAIFVLFYGLGELALFEPDEGRNAEIAREIGLTGNWTIPHYNFIPRLDKPVFFYWPIAWSYSLFGVSEWSARAPSAAAALATVLAVFLFARRFVGGAEALWAAVVLLTSVEFFTLGRVVIGEGISF